MYLPFQQLIPVCVDCLIRGLGRSRPPDGKALRRRAARAAEGSATIASLTLNLDDSVRAGAVLRSPPVKSVLPEGCRPIVVTDAGFRGPWFRDVEALGWDWVGRIRKRRCRGAYKKMSGARFRIPAR